MSKLSMADMNSLNGIASLLNHKGCYGQAAVLQSIQRKATAMIEEDEHSKTTIYKTVNVTNTKNVLVQVPTWIARKWGLCKGDRLEVRYDDEADTITIVPAVRRRGGPAGSSEEMA